MKLSVTHFTLASSAFLVAIIGCSGSTTPIPRLNIVNGEIVFTDARAKIDSADHCIVQFHPTEGGAKGQKIWASVIDCQFSMSTEEDGEKILGVPEGDYVVTITPPASRRTAVPSKYSDPKTTDIKVHVDEGENDKLEFTLKP